MRELLDWLEGKKTYIAGAVTLVLAILASDKVKELGIIPEHVQGWITLLALIAGGFTGAAHKAGNNRIERNQAKVIEVQQDAAADVKAAANDVTRAANKIAATPSSGVQYVNVSPPPPNFSGGV